ncbi:unnamed protein product [Lampetra fluviatilis]
MERSLLADVEEDEERQITALPPPANSGRGDAPQARSALEIPRSHDGASVYARSKSARRDCEAPLEQMLQGPHQLNPALGGSPVWAMYAAWMYSRAVSFGRNGTCRGGGGPFTVAADDVVTTNRHLCCRTLPCARGSASAAPWEVLLRIHGAVTLYPMGEPPELTSLSNERC